MNRRTGGPAQVKTDVVVALTTEQGRGVHGRAMFVVAPDGETVRCRPSLRTGPGEIVNPVRLIKDHRGWKGCTSLEFMLNGLDGST